MIFKSRHILQYTGSHILNKIMQWLSKYKKFLYFWDNGIFEGN